MTRWYKQLTSSEQRLLLIGAVLVFAALFWRLVMVPVNEQIEARAGLSAVLSQQLKDMNGMNLSTVQVTNQQPFPSEVTFSAWVDQQLNQQGLQETVNRTEPQNDGSLTVWLVNASFDQVIDWLQLIHEQYGIQVDQFDVTVNDTVLGLTNIRMRLVKS